MFWDQLRLFWLFIWGCNSGCETLYLCSPFEFCEKIDTYLVGGILITCNFLRSLKPDIERVLRACSYCALPIDKLMALPLCATLKH